MMGPRFVVVKVVVLTLLFLFSKKRKRKKRQLGELELAWASEWVDDGPGFVGEWTQIYLNIF